MRVLVTGGAGFIGSTLVDRLLAEGCDVDVVDDLSTGSLSNLADARAQRAPASCTFQRLDVRSKGVEELMAHRKPEVVFHLAAQKPASSSRSPTRPSTPRSTSSARSTCCKARSPRGPARSCSPAPGGTLYGIPEVDPDPEGHPQHPVSPYGVSKKAVGDYLHYYREVHGLEFTVLALANVYGPRQDPHGEAGVVAIFAAKLLDGERPTIFGDGEQTRDFVYVDDVVDAFVRAAEKAGGLTVNIGTGIETSVQHLYDLMARSPRLRGAGPLRAAPGR